MAHRHQGEALLLRLRQDIFTQVSYAVFEYYLHLPSHAGPRDLLARHDKLAHDRDPSLGGIASVQEEPAQELSQESSPQHEAPNQVEQHHPAADLHPDLRQSVENVLVDVTHESHESLGVPFVSSQLELPPPVALGLDTSGDSVPGGFGDDLDFLWGNFDMNSTALHSSILNYPMNFPSFPEEDLRGHATYDQRQGICSNENVCDQEEEGAISRYGSRLPSPLAPESLEPTSGQILDPQSVSSRQTDASIPHSEFRPWRISHPDYELIRSVIGQTPPVQAGGFKMPSRHALNRYVEGYFSGFHEHLPFMHLPTTNIPTAAPELILAIAAVGAQYRFQAQQARQLSECARALISWRLDRLYQSRGGHDHRNFSFGLSETRTQMPILQDNGTRPGSDDPQATMEGRPVVDPAIQLLQAMILIMALGTWNQPGELNKSVHLGMQAAILLRELGLTEPDTNGSQETWESWVSLELQRRTKLVAYCFLNLHSIAYNWPPQIINKSIELQLPCCENVWRAGTSASWSELRSHDPGPNTSFKQAYADLFEKIGQDTDVTRLSSFGNYIMAHVIIQQVFYARQAMSSFEAGDTASLPENALNTLESALGRWQKNWESTEDSSIDPSSPGGPLSFNSTALFRIAYVRMHADLGAYRFLETFDPARIAQALSSVPHLARSVHVCRAVLQCIHALSIPVRIGIEFVSRTQTLSWSIIHSLCNFECAAFLSQWLNCVATKTAEGQVASDFELRLVYLVQGVLRETEFAEEIDGESDLSRRCKRMAAAVARVCSRTLRGVHVWEIMDVMGSALEMRADMF